MIIVITTPLRFFHICICLCICIRICICICTFYFTVTFKMIMNLGQAPQAIFSFLKDDCNPVKEASQGKNVPRANFYFLFLLKKCV